MARTKILATIGPASENKVRELVEAGLDGIRVNMSHEKPEHFPALKSFIDMTRENYENLFFVGDLQGPKIRLGDFETRNIKSNIQLM